LNSNLERNGSFECSNKLFNEIQRITDWTFLSNIFSVQSDCPHRERFGYGGDIAVTTDAFIYNYDMSNFYTKVVRDFQDAAFPNGRLTDTAPFVGIDYCGIGWAFSHPLTLLELYQYYGNIALIEEQYDIARKWFENVIAENDLIITNGLSDHESLVPIPTSEMVTPLYYQSAKIMERLAKIINRADDEERYGILSEKIKAAYLEKFLEKGSGKFSPNTQASQSFALYINLAPEDEIENAIAELVTDIEVTNQGHLTTGIFGTKYSLDILSQYGHIETASKIVSQKSFPGWGYMIANGATTLWEHWEYSDNTYSHNHPMFGSVSEWFYKWVAGIQADPLAVGFDKIVIRPQVISNVNWSKAHYISANGKIESEWERLDNSFNLRVKIPVNCSAKIFVPANNVYNITESGEDVSDVGDIEFIKLENGNAIFRVGSGSYFFRSQID
jgi:alpha-L-rhamnosidase